MAKEFKLPELGENIETADILKVLVSVGDIVKTDDILFELETDKATIEVPADFNGKIETVNIKDGDTAIVGAVLMTYSSIDENEVEESKEEVKIEVESKPIKNEAEKIITPEIESTESSTIEFKVPELGENIETADIVKVLFNVGDKIVKDQVLFEIETDKATVEVPAEFSGKVISVNIKEGETVKVGTVVGVFDVLKETDKNIKPTVEQNISPKEEVTKEFSQPDIKPEQKSVTTNVGRRKAMPDRIAPAAPSVRRFAREIGVDIHLVRGSGPGGRISFDDVKSYAKSFNEKLTKSGIQPGSIGIAAEPLPNFAKYGEIEIEAMTNVRKKTAQHLSYAWSTIPHVTQFDKADITQLEKLRKQFAPKVEKEGGKLTITSILLKIISSGLKVFPQFNSSIDMDKKEVILKKYFNIGIAADTPKGLLVPVIKNVDTKNIIQLSVELTEISAKARDGKLSIDEMSGGNFSISNLGGIGGTYFTPIVNSPEVAILGVSRGKFEPVYNNEQFEPRLMLPLSLSYDHRIIDGADGARFLRWICNALENPFLLSLEG